MPKHFLSTLAFPSSLSCFVSDHPTISLDFPSPSTRAAAPTRPLRGCTPLCRCARGRRPCSSPRVSTMSRSSRLDRDRGRDSSWMPRYTRARPLLHPLSLPRTRRPRATRPWRLRPTTRTTCARRSRSHTALTRPHRCAVCVCECGAEMGLRVNYHGYRPIACMIFKNHQMFHHAHQTHFRVEH